jgi:hypothetical protein
MRKSILPAWLCAGLLASALAGTYKVPRDEPLAAVQIPEGWKTKQHDELVETASPDGALRFLVLSPEAHKISESMGEVMRYIRNTGGITVKAESVKRELGELNGMEAQHISWEGKDKNGEVKIRFSIVSIAQNRILLVAFWGSPAAEKKYQAELTKMLKSVKKA